jgi:hypothetical protein
MLVSIYNYYWDPAFAKPDWRQAARYVRQRAQVEDVVMHTSEGSFLTFLCYEHSRLQVLLPEDPDVVQTNAPSQSIVAAVGGLPQTIEQAVQARERAWLVVGLDHAVEHQLAQKAKLDQRYLLVEEHRVGGVHVLLYSLSQRSGR